jgi:uncharacterized protein
MKCEELLALLSEYVDGTVDPALCEEFERHMAGCNPCQVVVDNIRQTVTLYQHGRPYELPSPFRDRLHQALREKWRGRHRSAAGHCEMPLRQASSEEVRRIFASARTVAVVGLSDKPDRDSHRVAAYLQAQGYRIIPVNPNAVTILGERVYARLSDVAEPVDVVDIFRRPDAVPEIVEEAITKGARAVWMQEGIVHNAAADRARAAGLQVVMNRCMLKEHRRLNS